MKPKSLKKVFSLFAIALSAIVLPAKAQLIKPGFTIGGNVMWAKPTSDFAATHNYGIGGEVYAGIGLGKTYLVGTAGVANYFSGNSNFGSIGYTPLKLGIRRYFLAKRIFAQADAGTAKLRDRKTGVTESRFTRGAGVGIRLAGFEGGIYYDGWNSTQSSGYSSSVNFKLGYSVAF